MFFPLLSLLVVFGMETPMMSRLGSIYGNVNMILWLAFYFISIGDFVS
jgi:hypothetical protein